MDRTFPSGPSSSRSTVSPPHSTHHPQVPFIEADSGLNLDDFLTQFWTKHMGIVEVDEGDARNLTLPLARIKKVMKSDEDVKVGVSLANSPACETRTELMVSDDIARRSASEHSKRQLTDWVAVPIMFAKACESTLLVHLPYPLFARAQ